MARRILVAFDESPQAHAALRHVLTTYQSAAVTVLHVNDPREWVYADGMGGGYFSEGAFENAKESAAELMVEAEAIAEEHRGDVTTAIETGRTADTIVDYAEANEFDHIVLGSHGRTGLSRFLLGSVAETVARRAPVSVTIIREETVE